MRNQRGLYQSKVSTSLAFRGQVPKYTTAKLPIQASSSPIFARPFFSRSFSMWEVLFLVLLLLLDRRKKHRHTLTNVEQIVNKLEFNSIFIFNVHNCKKLINTVYINK